MAASFQVLLYYKYVHIPDPHAFVAEHRRLCERLRLLGRIIVAREGINGTASGPRESAEEYCAAMAADPRFADMAFKVDAAEGHAFPKLYVVRLAFPFT